MEYFSDNDIGPKVRVETQLAQAVWAGIVAHIQSLISTGAFGEHFPEICPDGAGSIGTNERAFSQALRAEIPDIEWPLKVRKEQSGFLSEDEPYVPDTIVALDLIQFCYMHVAKPVQGSYHSHLYHHHLSFDTKTGQKIACTADTKTIVRSLCDTADLNGIFVDNIFVRFGIALLVIDIPAKVCEQRVNEFAPYLRFIVLAGFIRFTMRIKTLNQFNNFCGSIHLILSLLSAHLLVFFFFCYPDIIIHSDCKLRIQWAFPKDSSTNNYRLYVIRFFLQ